MFDPGTFQARLLDAGQDAAKVSALWQDVESWHNHCLVRLRDAARAAGMPDVGQSPPPTVGRVRRLVEMAQSGTFDQPDVLVARPHGVRVSDIREGLAALKLSGLQVAAIVLRAEDYSRLRKAGGLAETGTWPTDAKLLKAGLMDEWFSALVILDKTSAAGRVVIVSDPDLKPTRRVIFQMVPSKDDV